MCAKCVPLHREIQRRRRRQLLHLNAAILGCIKGLLDRLPGLADELALTASTQSLLALHGERLHGVAMPVLWPPTTSLPETPTTIGEGTGPQMRSGF